MKFSRLFFGLLFMVLIAPIGLSGQDQVSFNEAECNGEEYEYALGFSEIYYDGGWCQDLQWGKYWVSGCGQIICVDGLSACTSSNWDLCPGGGSYFEVSGASHEGGTFTTAGPVQFIWVDWPDNEWESILLEPGPCEAEEFSSENNVNEVIAVFEIVDGGMGYVPVTLFEDYRVELEPQKEYVLVGEKQTKRLFSDGPISVVKTSRHGL